MSLITPVNVARALGLGRVAVGLAILAVPAKVGESWLGADGTTPGAQVALRGLGIRDVLVGMAQAHTASDPERGYRWARTASLGDAVDLVATLAAAKHLPRSGVLTIGVVATGAAVSGVVVSRWMEAEA
ncbi:hypothetical protein [Patulibacter sp.]|uniref:hypothetical protein n=1 Tax=Patulibacter sp. TaxID=1912859 RepID=UPI00271E4E49|nr:hypothetical protein [Patulibacter sp.]MDO9408423.1 hypothetical protein [Patulibacter sp.]